MYYAGLGFSCFMAIALLSHVAIAHPILRNGAIFLLVLAVILILGTVVVRSAKALAQMRDKYRWWDGMSVNALLFQGALFGLVAVLVGVWTAL